MLDVELLMYVELLLELDVDHSRSVDELSELSEVLDEGVETVLRLTSELVDSELVLHFTLVDDEDRELLLDLELVLLSVDEVDGELCIRIVLLVLSLLLLEPV